MCLYTANAYEGTLKECNEGILEWVKKKDLFQKELWEGDRIFLKLLEDSEPFFSLKLIYDKDQNLKQAVLNGRCLDLETYISKK